MKSTPARTPNGRGNSVYKEVRFSPTANPARRSQSLSGSSSSAQVYHNSTEAPKTDTFSILSTYAEQSRSLLEKQRALFAQERDLWDKERALLKSRITELESLLKGRRDQASEPDPIPASSQPFASYYSSSRDLTPEASGDYHHVSEGSSFVDRPTRELTDMQEFETRLSLPRGPSSLSSFDAALSPRSRPVDQSTSLPTPVPIEKLDSKSDGITLKSTALPPDVAAHVITSSSPSPKGFNSTSPRPQEHSKKSSVGRRNSVKLKLSDLKSPLVNLTRDAGHTPMTVIDAETDTHDKPSADEDTPRSETSTVISQTSEVRQPSEKSDTYFPEPPDDPALKGPLSLVNDKEHDNGFLKELNEKLLDQERDTTTLSNNDNPTDVQGPSNNSLLQGPLSNSELTDEQQQAPELRFRSTTNVDTAFGASTCGLRP